MALQDKIPSQIDSGQRDQLNKNFKKLWSSILSAQTALADALKKTNSQGYFSKKINLLQAEVNFLSFYHEHGHKIATQKFKNMYKTEISRENFQEKQEELKALHAVSSISEEGFGIYIRLYKKYKNQKRKPVLEKLQERVVLPPSKKRTKFANFIHIIENLKNFLLSKDTQLNALLKDVKTKRIPETIVSIEVGTNTLAYFEGKTGHSKEGQKQLSLTKIFSSATMRSLNSLYSACTLEYDNNQEALSELNKQVQKCKKLWEDFQKSVEPSGHTEKVTSQNQRRPATEEKDPAP